MIFHCNIRQIGFAASFAAALLCSLPSGYAQEQQAPAPAANPPAAAPAAAASGVQEQMVGPWHVILSTDDKGQDVTELRVTADRPFSDDAGREYTPDFVLICRRNKTLVYIDTKNALGAPDDTSVQLQYGSKGGYPVRAEWKLSRDRTKVIAPDPLDFVTEIRDKPSLDFQITPFQKEPIGAFFKLDSIEQAFTIMSQRCYE